MRLGRANVDALARSLTAKQFAEWEAYAALEPFDEMRQDYRIASIVQAVLNVNISKKKDRLTLEECLLPFGEQDVQKQQTWQEQQEIMLQWVGVTMADRTKLGLN